MVYFGGIEAGGTKFVCAVADENGAIQSDIQFPTTTPDETLQKSIDFFNCQPNPIAAVGIGTFGPIDPEPGSPTFGYITSTPKPGWVNTDFAGEIQQALGLPIGFDTDVNAAALGEHRWGAAQDVDTFIYLTLGTGIGGGGMVRGELLHGLMHPEMGHVRIPHDRTQDPFPGICPFHKDCLEGLAAGPAIEARWGQRGETLPPDHPAWPLEASYLAHGLVAFICVLSPKRIILGGGMIAVPGLLEMVRERTLALLNNYIQKPEITAGIDRYIVTPGLGNRAGVLGAVALAMGAEQQ